MKNLKQWLKHYRLFIGLLLLMLVMLQLVVQSNLVPAFIIPAPSKVIEHILENWRILLFDHLWATMLEFTIGFTLAAIAGIALAVGMFFSKTIEKMIYPFVLMSQMIPIIALSPIFVLWFGYSLWSKVAVTILMSFFPIVVSSFDGLRACDKGYIELLRSMGANNKQIFMKLHIPMALPSLFSGLKIGMVYALVGATIGEWLGASEGLGFYSRRMSGDLNADGVFAAIVLLTIIGLILFGVATMIERKVLSWKNGSSIINQSGVEENE
ncbi:ABC transporter permease [Robertmurraya andreesenii]|uniref:Hydroxymethylpyrimidine transport system permease protein n=1 Tax=Anoxybacillus andreesenii TaxID=1325932 RepID=A0ABT9V940_9BACL|nr:ABC transporter permease [Robertmurraya andreesenii]MDQ0157480.1 putative hydroxymethylpyrimidine transport system permease protein [Robertmurraya andreesenii]